MLFVFTNNVNFEEIKVDWLSKEMMSLIGQRNRTKSADSNSSNNNIIHVVLKFIAL